MSTQRVQFTEWLPDQPDNSGGLNDALNVMKTIDRIYKNDKKWR